MIDSMTYVKRLESIGVPRSQAEIQVGIMVDAFNSNFATKDDLARTELTLTNELKRVDVNLTNGLELIKLKLTDEIALTNVTLGLKVEASEARLLLKLSSLMIALFAIGVSITGFISR